MVPGIDRSRPRTFVRDSLVSLFPERKADILKDVDPGEYGAAWNGRTNVGIRIVEGDLESFGG